MDLSKEKSKGKKKTTLSYGTLRGCNIVPLGSWILIDLSNAEGYVAYNNSIFQRRRHFAVSYGLNLDLNNSLKL